jgi:hypothetical protein
MSTGTAVLIAVIVLLVVLAILAGAYVRNRRVALQQRFGPEYDRAVQERGGRFRAERDLAQRERIHDKLDLRPLSEESRGRYAAEWADVQRGFVDDPQRALDRADGLVGRLLAERGYPTEDRGAQEAALSVEHARVLDRYREAHEISALNNNGKATTDQLRQATVDYRSLVEELLGAVGGGDQQEER